MQNAAELSKLTMQELYKDNADKMGGIDGQYDHMAFNEDAEAQRPVHDAALDAELEELEAELEVCHHSPVHDIFA